ncbi:MAG: SLATT domain-containing protein [Chroococcus sp. CMT-3BRIN-NPC107]|jgi:hypothetical protein|nr:SLATT domain-containing protein [Chroococcus sp. CMT-3BRIN-NPC107]
MTLEGDFSSEAYVKLSDNIYIVLKSYFAANKRLLFHNSFSQWTLSLLSLGLIVIPLLTITKIPLRFQQNVIDFASVSLAVAVLMFSLLIGASNYSLRGEKMYQAGLELNELNRDMKVFKGNADCMKHYCEFNRRYSDILKRYENVDDIDHVKGEISRIRNKLVPCKLQINYYFLLGREILIYIVALTLEFGFIGLLVTKNV